MASYLDGKIKSLTGIDITDSDVKDYLQDWIHDAVREVYSFVPKYEKFKYSAKSSATLSSTGVSVSEPVLSVIWSVDDTFRTDSTYEAREMLYSQLFMFNKTFSLFKASQRDPIYYYEPQASGTAQKIKAHPNDGYIKVISLQMPTFLASDETSLPTIPNEIDHLIILNASLKALHYLLQREQDEDIYVPLISSMKSDYIQSVQLYLSQFQIKGPEMQSPSKIEQPGSKASAEELQKLIEKYS